MVNLITRLVFPSSFDSTRYTAVHPRDDHPNLAQAQAEAVTTLLLGRPLGITNTYAFDSRTVLNLIQATLETRDAVYESADSAGKERIDNASPFRLRWYAPTSNETDFLSCCAEQLLRQKPSKRRFVLSHWKKIDGNDPARTALANALTADKPSFPHALKEIDFPHIGGIGELEHSFNTLIQFDKYCQRHHGSSGASGKSHLSLLEYVQDFEGLDDKERHEIMDGKIDIDTVMHLKESVSRQPDEVKRARSWAHTAVEEAGGEEKCGDFLLQQRQLIDTLYNEVLADSVGSNHDLLSSVPRAVGNEKLEEANLFALNLIRFSKQRRKKLAAADGIESPGTFDPATNLSEIFVSASAEPDLPTSPVRDLLTAYWQLIAENDMFQAWQESCDYLEGSLNRALELQLEGRRAGSQLSEAWHAHLDMLQDRLPYVREYEGSLATAIQLSGRGYCTLTGFREPSSADESMAAGEYIDRYLRGRIR